MMRWRGLWLVRAVCVVALPSVFVAGCDRVEPAAETSIHVTDDTNRVIGLQAPAQRIVSLIPSMTDVVLALGVADRLVARTRYDLSPVLDTLPSMEDALTPSVEWLLERQPDLVIAWPDRQSRTVVTRLDELGIAVYTSRIETLADMRRGTRNIGLLVGRESAADSLVAALDSAISEVRRAVSDRPRPSVLYLIGLDPPISAGPGSFIDELIEIAGGDNILRDAITEWPPISVEEIVSRAPDVVIVAMSSTPAEVIERLRTIPGMRRLDAVAAGRVHVLDASLFNRPGPGLIEAVRVLASAIHPAAFRQ